MGLDGARKKFLIYPTLSSSGTLSPLTADPGSPGQWHQEGSGYGPSTTALQLPPGRGAPYYSSWEQDVTTWLCCRGRCWGSCTLGWHLFITWLISLPIQCVAMGRSTPQREEKCSNTSAIVWGFLELRFVFLSPNLEDNFHPWIRHYFQTVQLLRVTGRMFETANNKI